MSKSSYFRPIENSLVYRFHAEQYNHIKERKPKYFAKKNRYNNNNNTVDPNDPYYVLGLPNEITSLRELIQFAFNYKGNNVNIQRLIQVIPILKEIDTMIGMKELKTGIMDMVMYFVQGMYDTNQDYLHTVVCGPPGTGKTHIARLLAKLYSGLDILPTDKFEILKRTDLVGKYLGHTAIKTKEALDKCLGGVVFIDEAYSLAPENSNGNKDSYSKEAIDVLNEYLSNHKNDFVCIIGGYEQELENTIFSINKGMKRRFPWKFRIHDYNEQELYDMFHLMVERIGWNIEPNAITIDFFKTHKNEFSHFGGDIETFITKCKFAHIRRIFGTDNHSKILTTQDIDNAIIVHKQHKQTSHIDYTPPPEHMYT